MIGSHGTDCNPRSEQGHRDYFLKFLILIFSFAKINDYDALFSPHNGSNQTNVYPQTKTKDKYVRLSERMRENTAGRDSFSSVNVDLWIIVCVT